MRRAILAAAAICQASGGLLVAEKDTDFQSWMQANGRASGVLQKLEKKTGPEAVVAAERIASNFENMIHFWRQRGIADATEWSMQGKAAALQLAAAAYAGDAEKAAAAQKTLGGTCRTCHTAYREQSADGTYRIRYQKPEPQEKK
jgi:cytochrome c556